MYRQIKEEKIHGETYILDAVTKQNVRCPFKDCCCTISCAAYLRIRECVLSRKPGGDAKETADRVFCNVSAHDLIIGDF